MRNAFTCLLALCLPLPLLAVDVPVKPDWTPSITLPAGLPNEKPIELASASYEVSVRGLFADTTATLVFRNPNGRALFGDLDVPLPDGATVCGYALDVDGHLVDGVVVGKDQGRVIVESERRRRIDPGLVEQVRGNDFRTSIFPLPAGGTRTVRLSWTAELDVAGDQAAARVPLPRTLLPVLDLKVDINAGTVEPTLGGFGNLALTRWHDSHVAEAHLTDVTPGDDLLIRLPDLPPRLVMVEERQGERFIAVAEAPATAAAAATAPLPQPKRLAVAWDASGSRTEAGIAAGRQCLLELLKRWPGTALDVVVFRDVPEPAVRCADADALAKLLDGVAYDGGTALARLDLRRAALPDGADAAWILVSDGLGTVPGASGLPATDDVPVQCVAAESVRDAGLLRLLAARTGGRVVDALAEPAARAAERLTAPAPGLLRVDAPDGVLADVEIGRCQDRTLVLARLTGDGEIDLVRGVPGAPGDHARIAVRAADAIPGVTVARAWAGARAEELGVFPAENADALLALGRKYGLVTPGTSLLVLERLDQYLRHHVEPPESLPDMRAQYFTLLKQRGDHQERSHADQVERIVNLWHERVTWWERGQPGAPLDREATATGAVVVPEPVSVPEDGAHAVDRSGHFGAPVAAAAAPAAPPVAAVDLPELAADDPAPQGREEAAADSEMGGSGGFFAIGGGGAPPRRGTRGGDPEGLAGTIAIAPFEPGTPYLAALAAVPPDQAYTAYLRERASHRVSPSFYLDCASFLLPIDAHLGRRVLSNLAELKLDDPALLRVYAWRLQQAGDLDGAVAALRAVLRLRPDQPQSYRDLALALGARGESAKTAADLEEAMGLLLRVATHQPIDAAELGDPSEIDLAWMRAPDLDLIAVEELNALVARAGRGGFDRAVAVPAIDPRLVKNLDDDVRVVMSWDQDATDIDLHVIEPAGDEGFYGHRFTTGGGQVSRDCTQGYGPEEYVLRASASGDYQIRCQFYGSHVTTLYGPVTVVATVFLDWGRPTQRKQVMTLRLDQPGEGIPVGTLHLGGAAGTKPSPVAAARTITRAQLAGLHPGQDRIAIVGLLGDPVRVDGGGLTVLVYRLDGGDTLRLALGPDLLWAHEVADGAERDLALH
jgi:hypothetical protein